MWQDPTSKLDYDDARWYDPANGVFKSPDPTEFNGGDTNLYRFCGNSPTNYTDPSGLDDNASAANSAPAGDTSGSDGEGVGVMSGSGGSGGGSWSIPVWSGGFGTAVLSPWQVGGGGAGSAGGLSGGGGGLFSLAMLSETPPVLQRRGLIMASQGEKSAHRRIPRLV